VDKPKNGDAAAIALLKWILAALLLLNGAALVSAVASRGLREGLLAGSGWDYAAGLLCAILGAFCWSTSYASVAEGRANAQWDPDLPREAAQAGSNDHAIIMGAMAIMLWVASLTTFIVGCEHVSWTPGETQEGKVLHRADKPALSERTARPG
jgi:hypothetical protein